MLRGKRWPWASGTKRRSATPGRSDGRGQNMEMVVATAKQPGLWVSTRERARVGRVVGRGGPHIERAHLVFASTKAFPPRGCSTSPSPAHRGRPWGREHAPNCKEVGLCAVDPALHLGEPCRYLEVVGVRPASALDVAPLDDKGVEGRSSATALESRP